MLWTVQTVLQSATEILSKGSTDTAKLDAELLLGHVLNMSRIQLIIERERPLSSTERTAFREVVVKRRNGAPVAYLLGKKHFWRDEFVVNSNVLIPRPETELLVEVGLEFLRERENCRILDLCTGSGCVALSLLKHSHPSHQCVAVDVSNEALAIAQLNANALGVADQIKIINKDVKNTGFYSDFTERFDLIVANPPYIDLANDSRVTQSVRDYEPSLALDAGSDSFCFYRVFADNLKLLIGNGGLIVTEFGEGQGEMIYEIFVAAGWTNVQLRNDYEGKKRIVCVGST